MAEAAEIQSQTTFLDETSLYTRQEEKIKLFYILPPKSLPPKLEEVNKEQLS
ncbi:MAG: hypothetical protein KDI13_02405 [Alphaproteobacteria bacterium]|nr:hypothetical protein [Alphaproteobacteria bacterium]